MHLGFVATIIAAVVAVLGVFQPGGWVWALSLVWVFLFGLLNYDHQSDRVSILNGLKRRDNALIYTKLVDAMLRRLKRILLPEDTKNDPMPATGRLAQLFWLLSLRARDPEDLKRLQASTLSWPVLDAALKIAVIYPLLLLLCQWGFTGEDTGIGEAEILAAEDRGWLRAVLVCPVAVLVITRTLASTSQTRVLEKASHWLLWLTAAIATAAALQNSAALLAAAAAAGAAAIAASLSGAAAAVYAGIFAASLGGAFGGAGATVLTSSTVSVAGTATVAAVVAVVGYSCANGRGGSCYAALVIGLWVYLVGALSIATGSRPEIRVAAFAIGLLPLINAVFDYFSYGITLGLIRFGRRQRNFLTGLVWVFDGIVAVLLLIGLGLGLSGTIATINYLAGQEFIALRPIFDDLKTPEGRAGYTWLTLTLLSTLVPTLVHLVLVFLSAFTWVPQRFKLWIARGIENQETGDLATLGGSAAAATLGALWAGIVAFGLWAIWLFITAYLESAGLAVLSVVECVVSWLGWMADPA